MSERQAETPMEHDTKPETISGQSWVYSSLIQTARPVANFAAKLGILPHLYSIYDREFLDPKYNEQQNKRLIEVWEQAQTAQVGFITLHITSQKDNENQISQMGMSKWRSDGSTHPASVHCQVEQGMVVSESQYPQLIASDFMFGDTEVITESDVGPWLDATFRSFHQEITCLAGHDIRRVLSLVQPYWKIPSNIVILDTRAIWEFEAEAMQHPSFKQTLGEVLVHNHDSSLDNAGNSALFDLELLRKQCWRANKEVHPLERASNITHGYRGNLQHSQMMMPADWSRM